MTYVLNDADALPVRASAKTVAPVSSGLSFWQRLYAAMIESRRRSVTRELRARHYLIGEAEIVLGGLPQTTLKNDADLPLPLSSRNRFRAGFRLDAQPHGQSS